MQSITQNDFLATLFALHPFIVALIILIWGWGNLLILAIKTNSLQTFLRHPGFTGGDLLVLPLVGFLITYFYQNTEGTPNNIFISQNWTYIVLFLAFVLSVLNIYKSLFVKKSTLFHILIIPHFFFYWFITYILINFAFKGLSYILVMGGFLPVLLYIGVLIATLVHLILPLIFGAKTFPRYNLINKSV